MDKPSFQDERYTKNLPLWVKMRDFKEGIEKAKKYLRKWEREDEDGYNSRLNTTTLYNVVENTIKTANGLLFKKELTCEGLNKDFLAKAEDIDNNDSDLNDFFKHASELALWYGVSYIVIDFPYNEDVIVNKQQQIQKGLLPYFSVIAPLDVPNFRYENNSLTQFTIKSIEIVHYGDFSENKIERYRVFKKGSIDIYEKIDDDLKLIKTIQTNINYIPIVPLYTNKDGNFNGKPRFKSLCDMNIKHLNYESQLDKTLFIASNPIPVVYGNQDEENLVIGVDRAMRFSNKDEGGFEWVEFAGTSVDKLQNKLNIIENQMNVLGLSVITQKEMTATEKIINKISEESDLSAIANAISWSATMAYRYWCDMMGIVHADENIRINNNFDQVLLSPKDASFYLDAYEKGAITRERFWIELQNRGALGEFDKEVETAQLEAKADDVDL